MVICFNYLLQLFPETVPYINFASTWTSHWNTDSSVKPSISGVTLSESTPWVHSIPVARHIFSFFSVIRIFEITYCIFVLKCFSCSKGAYIKYVEGSGGGEGWRVVQIFQKKEFVVQETIELNILWPSDFFGKYFIAPPINFSSRLTCSSTLG